MMESKGKKPAGLGRLGVSFFEAPLCFVKFFARAFCAPARAEISVGRASGRLRLDASATAFGGSAAWRLRIGLPLPQRPRYAPNREKSEDRT